MGPQGGRGKCARGSGRTFAAGAAAPPAMAPAARAEAVCHREHRGLCCRINLAACTSQSPPNCSDTCRMNRPHAVPLAGPRGRAGRAARLLAGGRLGLGVLSRRVIHLRRRRVLRNGRPAAAPRARGKRQFSVSVTGSSTRLEPSPRRLSTCAAAASPAVATFPCAAAALRSAAGVGVASLRAFFGAAPRSGTKPGAADRPRLRGGQVRERSESGGRTGIFTVGKAYSVTFSHSILIH